MKNTILIAGTYSDTPNHISYNLRIFAQRKNENLTMIRDITANYSSYLSMWEDIKNIVANYFSDNSFKDGAYTILHDYIIRK